MRVLFVDQYSDFGGAQLALRDVMDEARARGWEPWFAAPGTGDMFAHCSEARIPVRALPTVAYRSGSKSLRDMFRFAFDMSRCATLLEETTRQSAIDVLYVNGPRMLVAAAEARRPVVFHLHSVLNKKYTRLIVRRTLRRGASVIAASQFVARGLGSEWREKARIIYNGARDFGFVARPRAARVVKVGIVGRISHEKGHLDFVRAARVLTDRGHAVQFVVVGAALFSDPSYEAIVRKAAAGTSVEFRGWSDDVAGVLHEIDILAAPCSPVECSPRIIIEAFSAGTPVVAYGSGGIPELIRSGDTGILTAQNSHEALAAAIERLMANRDLMARLSANGRREWEARFRIERFRKEVAEVIERGCETERG